MARLKAGDRVSCKLRESNVVGPYEAYDDIRTFEVIGIDSSDNIGYYLFVPQYVFIKNSKKLDTYSHKSLHINSKFIGEDYILISEKMIYEVSFILNGMSCSNCHLYFEYAESNQENGGLLCYSCRQNPFR